MAARPLWKKGPNWEGQEKKIVLEGVRAGIGKSWKSRRKKRSYEL